MESVTPSRSLPTPSPAATTSPSTTLQLKPSEFYELVLTPFIADKLGVGRIVYGVVFEVSPQAVLFQGQTILRPPPSGTCRRCRRPLSDAASLSIGYGQDCAAAIGLTNKIIRSWKDTPSAYELTRADRAVTFQPTWIPRSQITSVFEPGQTLALEQRIRREMADQEAALPSRVALDHPDTPRIDFIIPPGDTPFEHQFTGASFAVHGKRTLNGDEPGLGKSWQAILFSQWAFDDLRRTGKKGRILYVTLATLKRNIEREFKRRWPGVRTQIMESRDDKVHRNTQVIIVNYDLLAVRGKAGVVLTKTSKKILASTPSILVVDESHSAKSDQAQRTWALLKLAEVAEWVLLMSGTLLVNRPRELIPQLRILGIFDQLFPAGEKAFKERYCGLRLRKIGKRRIWDDSGATHLDELHRILSTVMIRRKKMEVLVDKDGNPLLPEKQYAVVPVDLTNRKEYDAYELEIANADPKLQMGMLAHARELISVGKVQAAIELATTLTEAGQKVVIFAHHRATQEALARAFPDAPHIFSADSTAVRDAAEQRFQNDPSVLVILVSLKAGGVGLTLHAHGACSNAIVVDLGWTSAEMDQAHDRIHRIGQTSTMVMIWTLIAESSVDDKTAEAIVLKRAIAGVVLDGEAVAIQESLVKRETIKALVTRVHQKEKSA